MNKRALRLKEKLAAGDFTAGIWVTFPCPTAFEIIADCGLDWVIVDAEHATFSSETLLHMLMAFKATQTVPWIRLPWNDAIMVKKALDMGFDGVVFPGIGTLEDVQAAVSSCRYPPAGKRGFGPIRVSGYGQHTQEYARTANEAVFCIIQIEDISAGDQIDRIVSVPGVDGILVGPNDMSGTAGCFLDRENPGIVKTIQKIFDCAKTAKIAYGDGGGYPDAVSSALKKGCQLVLIGGDIDLLQKGLVKSLGTFNSLLAELNKR